MATQTVELARRGDIVVEKKYGMTYGEFSRKHLFANYPVVIGDACKDWSARNKFTPAFFKEAYGDREVQVEGKMYKLSEFIDLMMTATENNPAPYPCKLQVDSDYPELLPDVFPRFQYALPDRVHSKLLPKKMLSGADTLEIFFGSPGGQFPYIHYDYMCLHAYITQLYGQKEFTVIPPSQTQYVYPVPGDSWVSQVNDVHKPDLEQFPLFAKATPITFVVGPGETLFIPCGWWHTARSLTPTISVALDCLNASNWKNYMGEVKMRMDASRPLKVQAAQAYLSAVGTILKAFEKIGITV